MATQTLTTATSSPWVCPPGVNSISVECYGAGGAGGGSYTTAGTGAGGGGGGGAYSLRVFTVKPGNSYPFSVGVKGSGVAAAKGGDGGPAWFLANGSTGCVAKGGIGGNPGLSATPGAGGAGGAAGSGYGTTKWSGGAGYTGVQNGVGGGGGEGSGGAADGTTANSQTGASGTPGGDGGNGGANHTVGSAPGSGNGGGGGGAGHRNTSNLAGGNGTDGQIILTYTVINTNEGVAPRKIQSRSTTATSSSATLALAFSSAVAVGRALVAACIWGSATQTCTVSDSVNGAWTAIGSPQRGTGNLTGYTIQLFYFLCTGAGTPTVTMTCSGSNTYRDIAIHEFSGIDTVSALEASVYSGNVTASGNVITTASGITPTSPVCMLFCACMVDNQTTSVVAPFVLDERVNFGLNGTSHYDVYSVGTYTAAFNTSGTTNASMILVAFKSSGQVPVGSVIIRQENQGAMGARSATGADWDGTYDAKVELDSGVYQPSDTAYVAIIAKTSVSATGRVYLYYAGATAYYIAAIEIPAGTTSYTYFESQRFGLPVNEKGDFYLYIKQPSAGTLTVLTWRIVVLEGSMTESGLYSSETQIEIGSEETITNTTAAPLTNPKYWKYEAAKWNGTCNIFSSMIVSPAGGNVYIYIQEDDGSFGNWTDKQTVLPGASSYTLNILKWTFAPTDGRHYRMTARVSAGSCVIYNHKLLIDTYEGTTLFQPNLYNVAYDIYGGTAGSGETSQAHAQSFVLVVGTDQITGVKLVCKRTGSPTDNLVVDLVTSLGGSSLAQATLDSSTVGTVWAESLFTFDTPYTPSLSTTYYVQVTRSGARDASNYISLEGQNDYHDSPGDAYIRSNTSWATENYTLMARLVGVTGLTKLDLQYLLLCMPDAGAGLQAMYSKYVSSEWTGGTLAARYSHDASNAADSSKLYNVTDAADITNATVTGANQQIGASPFDLPTSGDLMDVNVTNSTGAVSAARILIAWSKISAGVYNESISLPGSGGITHDAVLEASPAASLAASGTVTAQVAATFQALAELLAGAAQQQGGGMIFEAALSLGAAGDFSRFVLADFQPAASLPAAAGKLSLAVLTAEGAVSLSAGAATALSVQALLQASAALAAVASFSSAGGAEFLDSLALAGQSSLLPQPVVTFAAVLSLPAIGSLTPDAQGDWQVVLSALASGAMTPSVAASIFTGALELACAAEIVPAGFWQTLGTVTLQSSAAMNLNSGLVFETLIALAAQAAESGEAVITKDELLGLVASGALSANAQGNMAASFALDLQATLDFAAQVVSETWIALGASATIARAAQRDILASLTLAAITTLQATGITKIIAIQEFLQAVVVALLAKHTAVPLVALHSVKSLNPVRMAVALA